MARGLRTDVGDIVYHVINRGNGRMPIFHSDDDYRYFEFLLREMAETYLMRILAYELMPNHWHLLLYPRKDGDLSRAMHWMTTAHVTAYRSRSKTLGHGHVYQGRYKSFVVGDDAYFLSVLKYTERNAPRAGLAVRAEDWRWGSAYRRLRGTAEERGMLAELPVDLPRDYATWINEPEPAELLKELRKSVNKGIKFGE